MSDNVNTAIGKLKLFVEISQSTDAKALANIMIDYLAKEKEPVGFSAKDKK